MKDSVEKQFKLSKSGIFGQTVSVESAKNAVVANMLANGVNLKFENRTGAAGLNFIGGVKAKHTNDNVAFELYQGDRHNIQGTYSYDLTRVVYAYEWQVDEDMSFINFRIKSPKSFDVLQSKDALGIRVRPYREMTDAQFAADILDRLKAVDSTTVPMMYVQTGEVDSNFGVESVENNFKRKAKPAREGLRGPYLPKNKEIVYEIAMSGGTKYNIGISVFPYRDGSKIEYRTSVFYNVGQGPSTSEEEVKSLVKEIEKIVND